MEDLTVGKPTDFNLIVGQELARYPLGHAALYFIYALYFNGISSFGHRKSALNPRI